MWHQIAVDASAAAAAQDSLTESQLRAFHALFDNTADGVVLRYQQSSKYHLSLDPRLLAQDHDIVQVLLELTTATWRPLATLAFRTLVQLYSQRRRFVATVPRVQLIIGASKRQLRRLLEADASELAHLCSACQDIWVFRPPLSGTDAGADDASDDSSDDERDGERSGDDTAVSALSRHKREVEQNAAAKLTALLTRFAALCVSADTDPLAAEGGPATERPRAASSEYINADVVMPVANTDNQTLLRDLGVHHVVLQLADLLASSPALRAWDGTATSRRVKDMVDALRVSFQFLAAFVLSNRANQLEVWGYRSVLQTCVGLGVHVEALLAQVVLDNDVVAGGIGDLFASLLARRVSFSHEGLLAMTRAMKVAGVVNTGNQVRAMRLLLDPRNEHVGALLTPATAGGRDLPVLDTLVAASRRDVSSDAESGSELLALSVVQLVSACTEGASRLTEKQTQAVVPQAALADAIVAADGVRAPKIKGALLELFYNAWMSVELPQWGVEQHTCAWHVVKSLLADAQYAARTGAPTHVRILASIGSRVIVAFLESRKGRETVASNQSVFTELGTALSDVWNSMSAASSRVTIAKATLAIGDALGPRSVPRYDRIDSEFGVGHSEDSFTLPLPASWRGSSRLAIDTPLGVGYLMNVDFDAVEVAQLSSLASRIRASVVVAKATQWELENLCRGVVAAGRSEALERALVGMMASDVPQELLLDTLRTAASLAAVCRLSNPVQLLTALSQVRRRVLWRVMVCCTVMCVGVRWCAVASHALLCRCAP